MVDGGTITFKANDVCTIVIQLYCSIELDDRVVYGSGAVHVLANMEGVVLLFGIVNLQS